MSKNLRLKKAREALKISQKSFAKSLFISSSYLSNIEKGERVLNDRVIKLASITYGISEQYLKYGKGDIFHNTSSEKIERVIDIFSKLPNSFQDFALEQLSLLLKFKEQKEEK